MNPKGFSVPFSIAKPTLGSTARPCRCPETHKKSEPSTQGSLKQPTANAATSRSHLTQLPHATKGLTQPLLVPEVGCWSNPLTEPRFGGVQPTRKLSVHIESDDIRLPKAEHVCQIAHFAGAQADARSGGAIICDATGGARHA